MAKAASGKKETAPYEKKELFDGFLARVA